MTDQPMNLNAYSYLGSATDASGSSAIAEAKLPEFNKCERVIIENLSTSGTLVVKSGNSSVTVSHPAAADTASNLTIVAPGKQVVYKKELSHTTVAVDASTGATISYSIQYGGGI